MMSSNEMSEDNGNYDEAIVAIAVGDDPDMDMDDNGPDVHAALDELDIDHEETWIRQCAGDISGQLDSDPKRFGNLPPGIQMKLVLDLREREKATLLQNLREFSTIVERLKEQLFESEDKRLQLESELDAENDLVEEMRREFEEMKEAHKARVKDIDRIIKEMMIQRERLSQMIDTQSLPPAPTSSTCGKMLSLKSAPKMEDQACKEQEAQPTLDGSFLSTEGNGFEDHLPATSLNIIGSPGGSSKSRIETEFERKLQTNPQFRVEFERFREFQHYYHTVVRNLDTASGNNGGNIVTQNLTEEYRKLLEFQLGYERILASKNNT